MKINKYYPFVLIYFFVNSLWLPFGLLYTIILTPLFYFWIITNGKKNILIKFFVFASPFIIVHLINRVDSFFYWRSVALFLTVYIFCMAFYTFVSKHNDVERVFRKLLKFNFILTIIALVCVYTEYHSIFWHKAHWGGDWPRLAMFTYEPSYYATLLVPIFAYFFIRFMLGGSENELIFSVAMISIPLVLTLSLGVIAGVVLAIFILFLINFQQFIVRKKLFYSFCITITSLLLIFVFLLLFYDDNPLFTRLLDFVAGEDQSGRGRTTEAFQLAHIIAGLKSLWWGVGPGQIKIVGDSVIKSFYNYPQDYGQVSIPNAFAETLALFGYVGVFLRLFFEFYLFFKTRVLNNYYQSFMFIYIFVYQFTGSFTTNIAEYVIWILAFKNVFPQFNKIYKSRKNENWN